MKRRTFISGGLALLAASKTAVSRASTLAVVPNRRIALVGLGGIGSRLALEATNWLRGHGFTQTVASYALDTDRNHLARLRGEDITTRLLWEATTAGGFGDPKIGCEVVYANAAEIQRDVLEGMTPPSLFISVAALGRGMGAGGTNALSALSAQWNIPHVAIVSMPFSWESTRTSAEKHLESLRRSSCTVSEHYIDERDNDALVADTFSNLDRQMIHSIARYVHHV